MKMTGGDYKSRGRAELEATGRKPQSTHKAMNMGQLVLTHGTFAKAFGTFAELFS
jgi:hypothetical protein